MSDEPQRLVKRPLGGMPLDNPAVDGDDIPLEDGAVEVHVTHVFRRGEETNCSCGHHTTTDLGLVELSLLFPEQALGYGEPSDGKVMVRALLDPQEALFVANRLNHAVDVSFEVLEGLPDTERQLKHLSRGHGEAETT